MQRKCVFQHRIHSIIGPNQKIMFIKSLMVYYKGIVINFLLIILLYQLNKTDQKLIYHILFLLNFSLISGIYFFTNLYLLTHFLLLFLLFLCQNLKTLIFPCFCLPLQMNLLHEFHFHLYLFQTQNFDILILIWFTLF